MAFRIPTPVQRSQSDLGQRSISFSSICQLQVVQHLCDLFNPHGRNQGKPTSETPASPSPTVTTRTVTSVQSVLKTSTLLSPSLTTSHSPVPTTQPTSVGDATATSLLQKTVSQQNSESGDISSSEFISSKSTDTSNTLITISTKTTPSGAASQGESTSTLIISGNTDTIFAPPHITSETSSSSTSAPVASGTPRKGVNAGAIAGGILGVLVFLLLIFYAIVLCRRRRRRGPPSAEFLDWSFRRRSPSVGESSTATSYAFGSAYATSSHQRSSTSHTTTTIGRGFKFPPLHT